MCERVANKEETKDHDNTYYIGVDQTNVARLEVWGGFWGEGESQFGVVIEVDEASIKKRVKMNWKKERRKY